MKVCVIGTGYVGLVTGVCLAHIGHDVICVDNNEAKVQLMRSGQSPIYEPGLSELMQLTMGTGKLSFSADLAHGVAHGDILFIAVGTPPLPTGESDTRYVEAVARGIGLNFHSGYKVIVNKSTVPIGSGDWVRQLVLDGIAARQSQADEHSAIDADVDFDVVSNPEFLREGSAIYDTFNPDRIVLGSGSDYALDLMRQLYAPIVNRQFAQSVLLQKQANASVQKTDAVPVMVTDLSSAEMIKYAANAFLATKISFINEVANICDRVGADITQVALGIGLDSRIGAKFLNAGIGWGGSCFPKDVAALVHTAQDYGYNAPLLTATITTNQRQRLLAIEKLQQVLKILKGKTVGLLGLTFKPDTDDMRDAPAIDLIEQLTRLGAKVKAYDPMYLPGESAEHNLPSQLTLAASPEALAKDCDALILVTDWPMFQQLDFSQLAAQMTRAILIDGRNCLNSTAIAQAGFDYIGMGRPSVSPVQKLEQQLESIPSVSLLVG
jgi:UDPglucose 6-dehydrogenase